MYLYKESSASYIDDADDGDVVDHPGLWTELAMVHDQWIVFTCVNKTR